MSPEQNVAQLFSIETGDSQTQAIITLVNESLNSYRHFDEGRGAHDPEIWKAYCNRQLTPEQLDQLRLIPGHDYFPLEETKSRDLGHVGIAAAM